MPTVPTVQGRSVLPEQIPGVQMLGAPSLEALGGGESRSQVAEQARGMAGDAEQMAFGIAMQARQEAEQARLNEEEKILNDYEMGAVYAPEKGALWQKGNNAFGATDRVMGGYGKLVDERSKGLTSPTLKRAYAEMVENRRRGLEAKLSQHEGQQRTVVAEEATSAGVASWHQLAAADPRNAPVALGKIAGLMAERGRRMGWTREVLAQETLQAQAGVHSAAIQKLADDGKAAEAQAYYDQVAPSLDERLRAGLKRVVEESKRDAEVVKITSDLLAAPDAEIPALKAKALEGKDPETRRMVNQAVDYGVREREEARRNAQEALYEDLARKVDSGAVLSPSERTKALSLPAALRDRLADRNPKYDPQAWERFSRVVDRPDALAGMGFSAFDLATRGMDPRQYGLAKEAWEAARKGETERVKAIMTPREVMRVTMMDLETPLLKPDSKGRLSPAEAQTLDRAEQALALKIEAWKKSEGKGKTAPSDEDLRKLSREVLRDTVTQESGWKKAANWIIPFADPFEATKKVPRVTLTAAERKDLFTPLEQIPKPTQQVIRTGILNAARAGGHSLDNDAALDLLIREAYTTKREAGDEGLDALLQRIRKEGR
jgi:hypothetical protein